MRIGLLSFAHHHSQAYLERLQSIPRVAWIGAADDDAGRGRRLSQAGGAQFFSSFEDLLGQKLDGVIVCAETARRRRAVEMAAAAGVPVLCEVPLATTAADARAMVDACQRAGVALAPAFPLRFSPAIRSFKQDLDAGKLGRPLAFNATNCTAPPLEQRAWYADKALSGGGALAGNAAHLVDLLRWLLGEEAAEVYARTNHIFAGGAYPVESAALEMITFASGVFASLDLSWSRSELASPWSGLKVEMVSERGSILAHALHENVEHFAALDTSGCWLPLGGDLNQAMLAEFTGAIAASRPPAVSGLDGLRAVEVMEAAYHSVEEGQPVEVLRY